MFPTLTAAQIARVAAHGSRRTVSAGDVLFEPGAPRPPVVHARAREPIGRFH